MVVVGGEGGVPDNAGSLLAGGGCGGGGCYG